MEFRFCIQDPTHVGTTYLYEAIIQAAVGAHAWRGVYAFASRDGVNHLIEDPVVEEFMREGGEVDLLVGLDAVTNRPTLERLREFEQRNSRFRPRVFWNETTGLFHPKLSDFRYQGGGRTLIVGSGNLTPGGLMTNYEGYTVIVADQGEEIDVSALDEFIERHSDQIRSIDEEALERAAKNLIRPIKGAPVVIYSMTSSSPEDAPRGMEFLYDPHRLNVASSRAKAMCILVGSPALFEPHCATPRQMKMANGLCRYGEVAAEI